MAAINWLKAEKKITKRNLKVAIWLVYVAFLCWLIIFPLKAEACGWYGDAEDDDDYESGGLTWIDNPEIQTETGNRYKEGKDVPRDYKEAVYWYRRAAEQGFAGAQNNLAVMYEQGLGVPKDESEAVKWYRKAAEGQNAKAQHSLGVMYRDGRGIPHDLGEAAKWISRAAEQSHHSAFRDMGEIYWKGLGVSQNNIRAYMWWRLGTLQGDKESERLLGIAAAKMNSSHVAEAEKLAQDWMQKHE
jgi:TPR repeat protein